jgi:CheY-like chemotaxis protein
MSVKTMKTVLNIEDQPRQRQTLHEALERRGFRVESPDSVDGVRKIARELGSKLDLVLLDMNLDEWSRDVTGADLAIEIKRMCQGDPPEFLINSSFGGEHYYRLAVELGAAAYLRKNADLSSVMAVVRALLLRRALRPDRQDAEERIERIARASRSRLHAIQMFCELVLSNELGATLGLPFVLLVTDSGGTQKVAGNAELPNGYLELYDRVQSLAFADAASSKPFVVNAATLPASGDQETDLLSRLDRAAFVRLAIVDRHSLSLGVMHQGKPESQAPEDAESLAETLERLLQPTAVSHLLKLTTVWGDLNVRRRAVLEATSRFCLWVGQQQADLLGAAERQGEVTSVAATQYLSQLANLGTDLWDTGALLGELSAEDALRSQPTEANDPASSGLVAGTTFAGAELVSSVWREVARSRNVAESALRISGDAPVSNRRDYLAIAVGRLLEWCIERSITGEPEGLTVSLQDTDSQSILTFEDDNPRLPKPIRDQFFDHFASQSQSASGEGANSHRLGLFVAKIFIELGLVGQIEDRTEDRPDPVGHRFIVRIPRNDGRLARLS